MAIFLAARRRSSTFANAGWVTISVLRLQRDEWADCNGIHFGPLKASDRLLGCANDGFMFVEGCVECDRNRALTLIGADQIVVQWCLIVGHTFQSAAIVHMLHSA